jgi:monoamine oxidase
LFGSVKITTPSKDELDNFYRYFIQVSKEKPRAKVEQTVVSEPLGPRVVIVGAGLAGLSAAYELRKHFDVMVLESAKRVGGRVHTLQKGFGKVFAEAGGEWIHPAHRFVHNYVKEFKLKLDPDANATVFLDDAYLRPLETEEKNIHGLAALRNAIESYTKKIRYFEPPEESALKNLDDLSFLEFLVNKLKASPSAISYLRIYYRTQMTVELEDISAPHVLYEEALPQGKLEDEFRINGGNRRLPYAFRKALGERILCQALVKRIEYTSRPAKVFYQAGQREMSLEAEHVIIAIPANQVRNIIFDPCLPREKANAYKQIAPGRQMKIIMKVSQEVWQRKVAGVPEPFDEALTNRAACFLYQGSHGVDSRDSLLTAYVAGRHADELQALPTSERARVGRMIAAEIWGNTTTGLKEGRTIPWCWNDQPRIGGSYAYFAPGQMTRVRPQLRKAVGCIHFAGEHTAIWQGYMNGAIESGLRAAAEIDPRVEEKHRHLLISRSS